MKLIAAIIVCVAFVLCMIELGLVLYMRIKEKLDDRNMEQEEINNEKLVIRGAIMMIEAERHGRHA